MRILIKLRRSDVKGEDEKIISKVNLNENLQKQADEKI